MSRLKKFLDRRSEHLGRKPVAPPKKTKEELVTIEKKYRKKFETLDMKEAYSEQEIPTKESPTEQENLSDDVFWAILQDLRKEIEQSEETPIKILERLLKPFSDKQVERFSEKYSNLNQ